MLTKSDPCMAKMQHFEALCMKYLSQNAFRENS